MNGKELEKYYRYFLIYDKVYLNNKLNKYGIPYLLINGDNAEGVKIKPKADSKESDRIQLPINETYSMCSSNFAKEINKIPIGKRKDALRKIHEVNNKLRNIVNKETDSDVYVWVIKQKNNYDAIKKLDKIPDFLVKLKQIIDAKNETLKARFFNTSAYLYDVNYKIQKITETDGAYLAKLFLGLYEGANYLEDLDVQAKTPQLVKHHTEFYKRVIDSISKNKKNTTVCLFKYGTEWADADPNHYEKKVAVLSAMCRYTVNVNGIAEMNDEQNLSNLGYNSKQTKAVLKYVSDNDIACVISGKTLYDANMRMGECVVINAYGLHFESETSDDYFKYGGVGQSKTLTEYTLTNKEKIVTYLNTLYYCILNAFLEQDCDILLLTPLGLGEVANKIDVEYLKEVTWFVLKKQIDRIREQMKQIKSKEKQFAKLIVLTNSSIVPNLSETQKRLITYTDVFASTHTVFTDYGALISDDQNVAFYLKGGASIGDIMDIAFKDRIAITNEWNNKSLIGNAGSIDNSQGGGFATAQCFILFPLV